MGRGPMALTPFKTKAAKADAWACRHLDDPTRFNPDGSWREGIDRFALPTK
jgi:hypothetical protein